MAIKAGATSETRTIFIQDTSGNPLTGLVFNSAGLTAYYVRPAASAVAIPLATLAAADSAWGSGGFKEIDATNMPGWYRFDIPNAAIAAGAEDVSFHFKGATSMSPLPFKIGLVAYDPQDAAALGISRIDAAVSTRAVAGDAMALTSGERTSTATSVWASATRTLTNYGTLVSDISNGVWGNGNRTMTSYGSIASDTATAVWASGTRTLTSFGTLIADIWASVTRTLTAQSDTDGTTTLLSRLTSTRAGYLDEIPNTATAVDAIDTKLGSPDLASVSADIAQIYSGMLLPADANRTVLVTAAQNVSADIRELQAGVITAGDFAADSITASALAADAVAEIQSGLSTLNAAGVRTAVGLASANLDTQLASIETNTNDLPTMIENDGLSGARFTEAALAEAPAGGGGGGGNLSLTIDAPSREVEATSTAYVLLASSGETVEVSIRGGGAVSSQKGYLVFATTLPTPNGQGTFETPGAFIATNDQASQRYTLSNSVNLYGRAVRRGATVTFVVSGEIA